MWKPKQVRNTLFHARSLIMLPDLTCSGAESSHWDWLSCSEHATDNSKVTRLIPAWDKLKSWTWWSLWVPFNSEYSTWEWDCKVLSVTGVYTSPLDKQWRAHNFYSKYPRATQNLQQSPLGGFLVMGWGFFLVFWGFFNTTFTAEWCLAPFGRSPLKETLQSGFVWYHQSRWASSQHIHWGKTANKDVWPWDKVAEIHTGGWESTDSEGPLHDKLNVTAD